MIRGTGIDMIEIQRIQEAFDTPKKRARVFTEMELQLLGEGNPSRMAGFFAAKEALAKALGTGISGFGFRDIEVRKDTAGKPYFDPEHLAPLLLAKLGSKAFVVHLTISHDRERAVAMVIIEEGEP